MPRPSPRTPGEMTKWRQIGPHMSHGFARGNCAVQIDHHAAVPHLIEDLAGGVVDELEVVTEKETRRRERPRGPRDLNYHLTAGSGGGGVASERI